MIVSIHQPAHLPWPGYLDRIARADVFIYLDTVQFEKNSFTNRNRIKTPQGVGWLTIPVLSRGSLAGTLLDLRCDESQPWRRNHLRSIEMNYRRARAFDEVFGIVRSWYADPAEGLAELCWRQLQDWTRCAGIATRLTRASALDVEGRKSDLVLALCRKVGASVYLSGPLGRGYLDEAAFARAGIEIAYHAYVPAPYPQLWGDFVPGLSALDMWMNCGTLAPAFPDHGRGGSPRG